MPVDLVRASAAELSAAYCEKKISPVEVTEAVLARIQRFEPIINAMYLLQADQALEAARASAARWQDGRPLSPLDGVPITIKDNVATRGDPTPLGTAALAGCEPATEDAPPAARVREAGCVILGKTTMPDFGMLASGVSSLHGTTRNPWDPSRNTAGSSSGAGAALAAGYGPLALGTDIGGSVRLPAAYCGVFALKPSLGRVPIHPPYWGRVTGPMTRTVADAAMLMTVLAKPDHKDFMSLAYDPVDYAARLQRDLAGLKVGLLTEIGVGLTPVPEVRAAVEAAAASLAVAGAVVTQVPPFLNGAMAQGLDRFFRARSFTEMQRMTPEQRRRILPFIRQWAERAESWSAVDLMRALNEIFAIREAAVRATQPFDVLLTPTSPIAAYEAGLPCPGADPERPFEHIAFTAPFNQSEQPAASINCGYTAAGLPIGLQIVGKRFDDLGVLQVARAYEELRPTQRPWPET
jgi:Asp-tRNA(Asn)/Glu-tRNA(Gln) amidotransferase A subunit family amidase